MDSLNGVISFFYNIIPGLLFLFINDYHFHIFSKPHSINNYDPNNVSGIVVLIALSLFIGFLFQSLTKIFRDLIGNKFMFEWIKCKDEKLYKSGVHKLADINRDDSDNVITNFYLMHNYLSRSQMDHLPEHFSARFAFWSNVFIGSFVSMFIFLFSSPQEKVKLFVNGEVFIVLIFIFLVYSFLISGVYFYSMYSSIINSFVMKDIDKDKLSSRKQVN